MLLAVVLLWSLNLVVTRYILTHGLLPLSYATIRYALAALVFVGLTLALERTLRVDRRHVPLLLLAAVTLWLNQVSFVLALSGVTQTTDQEWDVGWEIWPLLLFATLGPLVLTNVLWFRSIHRIGANRATLAANLQPFVAAVLGVVLLSESLGVLQVVGGVLIGVGILAVRQRP